MPGSERVGFDVSTSTGLVLRGSGIFTLNGWWHLAVAGHDAGAVVGLLLMGLGVLGVYVWWRF